MFTMTPISLLFAFLPVLPLLSAQPIAQHPCLGPGAAPASSLPPPTSAAQLDPSIAAVIQSFSEQLADVNDKLASLEAKTETETVTETTTTPTTLETTATVTETTAVPTTVQMTQTVTETTGEPTPTPTPTPTPAATPLDSATADSLPGNAALVATPEEDPAPAPAPASEPVSQPAPAPASEPDAAGESGGGAGSQSGVSDADKMNPREVVSADNPMAKVIVERHNEIRARFGAQPLKWNEKLAQDAFEISKQCRFDHFNVLELPNSGQNLMDWPVGSDKQSPEDRIKMPIDWWTLEGRFWGKGTTQVTGHFKTVVRMGQTQIGCGWNTCDGKSGVFFCNYDAAGAPIGDEIPEPKEQINWEADYAHGYDCDSDGGEVFTCIQKVAARTLAATDTPSMPSITPAPSRLAW